MASLILHPGKEKSVLHHYPWLFSGSIAQLHGRALPELAGQQRLRLIHAESDSLPDVIADHYDDTVVVRLTTVGAEKWRGAIADSLPKATDCTRIYERTDVEAHSLEGLKPMTG